MQLFHLSDLHLGRVLHGYPLIDDQACALTEVLTLVDQHHPDGMLIAGDIYDRALPPVEAVQLFDNFLTELVERKITVCVISGNHDSPQRLGFAGRLLDRNGIHIRCQYNQLDRPITLTDSTGEELDIFALPFVETALVREALGDENLRASAEAAQAAIELVRGARRPGVPAVLMAHEFVGQGTVVSDSERVFIGGTRVLESQLFEGFDYVALGHLHRPQSVAGSACLRYSGSLLQYSFSEASDSKSISRIQFNRNSTEPEVETLELHPRHRLVVLEDSFTTLLENDKYGEYKSCRVSARITDRDYHLNIHASLKERFPLLMEVRQLALEEQVMRDTGAALPGTDTPARVFDLFLERFGWTDSEEQAQARELFGKAAEALRARESEARA